MNKFTGQRLRNLLGNTGLVKLGLMILIGLAANAGKAQINFASAQVLDVSQSWGSVVNNNAIVPGPDAGAPSIAGFAPHSPLWYSWTAPADGEVSLDTIGTLRGLDTVLAVFTGASVSALSQVAANDDIYNTAPHAPINYIPVNIYITNFTTDGTPANIYGSTNEYTAAGLVSYYQPFGGPSGLRFNATAGTTYYFAVDTKSTTVPSTGPITLNWAYHSSGVFRFATESVDYFTGKLLYQCAETESTEPVGEFGNVDAKTVVHTYYTYNPQGLLVTVTRVGGTSGRVSVNYTTQPGTNNPASGDVGAKPTGANSDYQSVLGTLVFDDFEMSKTILIPIKAHTSTTAVDGSICQPNRDFLLSLSAPQLDPGESPAVSPPRVDPAYGQAMVRILDVDIDPKGSFQYHLSFTNPAGSTNPINFHTNLMFTPVPTNAILNFQKAHYRVARDVSNWWGATPVTIYVNRTGTNAAGTTANWRINNYFLALNDGYDNQNQVFPLQAGSDYAMPNPPTANGLIMGQLPPDSPDFTNSSGASGSLSWAANDWRPKAIHFSVLNSAMTKFNLDLSVQLYRPNAQDPTVADQLGMVAETYVTILFDDQHPPAGSVDELYNADYNTHLKLPSLPPAQQNNAHPGTDGEVYGLAVLPNNETVIVGSFFSYNNHIPILNGIALVDANGLYDESFNPHNGANDSISAVALSSSKLIIGGNFTSYSGTNRNYIARLNANGSLDTTFLTGTNTGADQPVRAVAVQPDGKVLIGGDFTHVNGTLRYYVARLNTNGSLDTSFDPGTTFDGSVHALALQPSGGGKIFVGGGFDVGGQGYGNIALLNSDGSLDTSFNPGTGPDDWVSTLCWQPNGQVLLGGIFTHVNGTSLNRIARLNTDGSIDTDGFSIGTGADSAVQSIIYSTNVISTIVIGTNSAGLFVTNTIVSSTNGIYVGGSFTSFNGTHRLGFTRLYTDGTVDTTFMDTAYNQFAGLPRIYFGDSPGSVNACGVQSDGSVMIAGAFDEVGGGQADKFIRNTNCADRGIAQSFGDPNLWYSDSGQNIEPKSRDGTRDRSNLARLIGGSINGVASLFSPANAYAPGNIGLVYNAYSANESQSFRSVELARVNGALGPAGVNFAVQPGLANSGVDYVYNANAPLYWIAWEYVDLNSRMHSHGLFATNGVLEDIYERHFWGGGVATPSIVQITVHPNPTVRGDLSAQFQLANPAGADQFYLGGQNIPMGVALGRSVAPFTLIDDNQQPGQFGFATASFIATGTNAAISVVRSNGMYGRFYVAFSTTNGTATNGIDYVGTNGTLVFNPPNVSNVFNVRIKDNGTIYTSPTEKTVNLRLSSITGPSAGATFGISNAVLRLINNHYKGYLSFSATNYIGSESAGFITFVVNRTSGNLNPLSVQYATTNGTGPNAALNGVDYVGATNTLSWTNGDVSSRFVNIPITNNFAVGAGKQFAVSLRNATNNGAPDPSLMGLITNATLTISNDNSYGTLQLSAPSYLVNEDGGYATITVLRTGGAAGTVSVRFVTSNGPYATNGVNYIGTNNVLTFAPQQIAASFNVQIINDGRTNNPNFYFNVYLTNAVSAALVSPTNAVVNILDSLSVDWPSGSPGSGNYSISGADDTVRALALQSNGQIVVGGDFLQVNSVPEKFIARLNTDGSLDTTFPNDPNDPGANGTVFALANQTNDRILMGGAFTAVNGIALNHIARLMTDGSLDTSFRPGPGADDTVYALAETFVAGVRKIYVGGAFSSIYNWNIDRPGIARLNDDGTVDSSFVTGSGADGTVYAIAVYPTNSIYAGKVLIGGAFTHYYGTNLNYIARLNADGSVDTTFTASANGTVKAIAIQPDGRVLVGGSFIQFNNENLNRIVRLNADGLLDDGFTTAIGTGINNTVEGIELQADNRIVLVGQFTQVHGLTCNRIVRLLPTGALDTAINFGDGANSDVNAVLVQPSNGMIVIGGAFTQFNDQPHDHLVRLYGGSTVGSISGGSLVLPAGSVLVSESFTPANHIIDPGETVTLSFAFTNSAGNNVSDLVATLLATNGITPSSPAANDYGPLNVGGPSVSRPFTFTATNGANGQTIAATFHLQSGTNNLGLGVFTYMLGTLTNTFANANFIDIIDHTSALPYPSTINVSGVGSSLISATVTFANLTHLYPSDIDALLESPSQQSVLLMAHAGGSFNVHGVTITFDANAPGLLPQTQIVSGTYQPSAYILNPDFPPPAPAAPAPAMQYVTNLASFNGSNPNGAWSLFVIDDQWDGDGAITNGWSLTLVTASPISVPPVPPLQFESIVKTNGGFQLTITGPTNLTYIQVATNLLAPNWLTIASGNPKFTFTDTQSSNSPYRFYRATNVSGP